MKGGRRIALLLTGVLPLLAEDDAPVTIEQAPIEDDENDVSPLRNAAEALHDDSLSSIPALPIEILEFGSSAALGNVVMYEALINGIMDSPAETIRSNLSIFGSELLNHTPTDAREDADRQEQPEPILADQEGGNEARDNQAAIQSEDGTEADSNTPRRREPSSSPSSDREHDAEHVIDKGANGKITSLDGDSIDESDTSIREEGSQAEPGQEIDPYVKTQVADSSASATTESEPSRSKDEPSLDMEDDDEDDPTERVVVDYASTTAGALILEKSPHFKGTSNLLNANKDKYAISPCEEKKHLVIGLSEDILVKQICLANYERYSSRVKEFQVFGSQTMGKWINLGTFTANPENGEQTFDLVQPSWARYLKFRFLSHYGIEHYCTISQIKVHGSTQLQGFHEEWEESQQGAVADEKEAASSMSATEDSGAPKDQKEEDKIPPTTTEGEPTAVDEVVVVSAPNQTSETAVINNGSAADHGGPNSDAHAINSEMVTNEASTLESEEESVLNAASIEVNSPKVANAAKPAMSKLDTMAITSEAGRIEQLKSAENLSSFPESLEALKTLTDATVSEVVREIQEKLIGLTQTMGKIQPLSLKSPSEGEDSADDDDTAGHELPNDTAEETDSDSASRETMESSEASSREEGSRSRSEPTYPDSEVNGRTKIKETDDKNESPERPTIPEMDVSNLYRQLSRLPSAKCLQELDFAKYKARLSTSTGSSGSTMERMEPIFKKLTDQIRSLQQSQSVQELFTREMVACYQSVLFDLLQQQNELQRIHNDRYTALESKIELLHSTNIILLVLKLSTATYEAALLVWGVVLPIVKRCWHFATEKGQSLVDLLNDEAFHRSVRDGVMELLNAEIQLNVGQCLGILLVCGFLAFLCMRSRRVDPVDVIPTLVEDDAVESKAENKTESGDAQKRPKHGEAGRQKLQ